MNYLDVGERFWNCADIRISSSGGEGEVIRDGAPLIAATVKSSAPDVQSVATIASALVFVFVLSRIPRDW